MVVVASLPNGYFTLISLVVVQFDYRHELAMPGLYDMIDRNLGFVLKNTENTFIEVRSDAPLWRPTEFKPREVMRYLHEGQRITDVELLELHASQLMFVLDWNARVPRASRVR